MKHKNKYFIAKFYILDHSESIYIYVFNFLLNPSVSAKKATGAKWGGGVK